MRNRIAAVATAGLMVACGLSACGDNDASKSGSGKPKIGVILPDTRSSARWETTDRKYLETAFKQAGVSYDIQNAQNDKQAFQTIAEQMITSGITVLMIVNLDSSTGKAVLDKARSQGIATIDYDRLTVGGNAQFYVSHDSTDVGAKLAEGLMRCLDEKGVVRPVIAELHGSQSDNNASEVKNGYDAKLQQKFDTGEYVKGPDRWVPNWEAAQAATLFEQMLTANRNISGVLAANDTIGNAAISVLKKNQLNGRVPVTGQDATVQGLQNVLLGDQCMTVYKAVKQEADAAATLAIGLANHEERSAPLTVRDPETGRDVPSILLPARAVYPENVREVVAEGFVTAAELCTGEVAARCRAAGILK